MKYNWQNYGGNLIVEVGGIKFLYDTDKELYEERTRTNAAGYSKIYWHYLNTCKSIQDAEDCLECFSNNVDIECEGCSHYFNGTCIFESYEECQRLCNENVE